MTINENQARKFEGRILRFNYPAEGSDDSYRCMEPRCVRVETVEISNGSLLITGHDFATGRTSTFCCESIEDLEDEAGGSPSQRPYRIKLIEIDDAESKEDAFQSTAVEEVQAWLGEWMNDPVQMGVIVLPPGEAA